MSIERSFEQLRLQVITRLDQGDRGDRGWFIITRVHVSLDWVKAIIDYLSSTAGKRIILTKRDYRQIGAIVGLKSTDPGIQLRRHHLLALEKPLQLIRRVSAQSWQDGIRLTRLGLELSHSSDPASVLERALQEVVFAREPWSPPDRISQYSDFKVQAYKAAIEVVNKCDGYLDRDEFDLFVARIRDQSETATTIDRIRLFRQLRARQQEDLLGEVAARIPSSKSLQNWRDMGLHTFSLFSLGISLVRDGQRLLATGNWADKRITRTRTREETPIELRIPEPRSDELLIPPAVPAANDGTDAESFVAKVYRSKGWLVSFYTNRRGYGFDLWARRNQSAAVIEVKSSTTLMGTVTLTPLEYSAAEEYGDSYILAIVEFVGTDSPRLTLIQNPFAEIQFRKRQSSLYAATREAWMRHHEGTIMSSQ
ncbi:MAG: DUF3883 domain-containing protein [Dehalococcoidia bacterium]|nr:DUF3883 domain-containing protein [Dehalococcoidia bacterium]